MLLSAKVTMIYSNFIEMTLINEGKKVVGQFLGLYDDADIKCFIFKIVGSEEN